jgi:hypothetical protein
MSDEKPKHETVHDVLICGEGMTWKNDFDSYLHVADANNGENDIILGLGYGFEKDSCTIDFCSKVFVLMQPQQAVRAASLLLRAVCASIAPEEDWQQLHEIAASLDGIVQGARLQDIERN